MVFQKHIKNYKGINFSKIIVGEILADDQEPFEFDINMPDKEGIDNVEYQEIYINSLISMLALTPTIKRTDFIDYQIAKYGNNADNWLNEVSGMINDYHNEINNLGNNLAEDYKKIINAKLGIVPISNLEWSGSDTDLLELIVALMETKVIKDVSRKEVIHSFQHLFNFEIKDAESKLSRARSRKETSSHKTFTESLKEAWDGYVHKSLK